MRWRSPQEIGFRLGQETRNLALFAKPPRLLTGIANAESLFPPAQTAVRTLRGTATSAAIETWARQILQHRFPLLGMEIETGPEIHWRCDYVSGKETPVRYFRAIPYLDPARAGDHKIIWELNRHQHLVLLAQAHLLTGEAPFLNEIERQLDSWFAQNPFQQGINWASALEVAFRSLSWMWVDHLVGPGMQAAMRHRLRDGLYLHALHLETNLSVYFSPNTHLLGEGVALHALGRMFSGLPPAQAWEQRGAEVVSEEMDRQVRDDGSHFEQSTYYHVYALDMFLFHAILAGPNESYGRKVVKMAEYLEALMGPSRSLPSLGDDDGGRFFHPFGPRDRFGRATLAACGCFLDRPEWIGVEEDLHEYALWWLGAEKRPAPAHRKSTHFSNAGTIVMQARDAHCILDAGPFGPFRAGHSHADTLSIVARAGDQDLLIDPGTFTYTDPRWRNAFRGTAAHNTVRVNQFDQADPAGSFGWSNPPRVTLHCWSTEEHADYSDGECHYRGVRHRRRVFFAKPELLFILDDITGSGTKIEAEQFWHPGGTARLLTPSCFRIAEAGTLILDEGAIEATEGGDFGWRSVAFGSKQSAPLIVCRRTGEPSVRFGAVLAFSAPDAPAMLEISGDDENTTLTLSGAWNATVTFPPTGLPRIETR